MLYSMKCPNCGWEGERLAAVKDRDTTTCTQVIPAQGETESEEICGAVLIRPGVELTALQAYNWANWRQ